MQRASTASDQFPPNDEDIPLCQNCEDDMAILTCKECNQLFCRDCSDVIHKAAKKRSHRVVRIEDERNELKTPEPDLSDTLPLDPPVKPTARKAVADQVKPAKLVDVSILDWTATEVKEWAAGLSSIGEQQAKILEEQWIRGRMLHALTANDLETLGFDESQQNVLFNAIARLRIDMAAKDLKELSKAPLIVAP